MRRTVFAAAFLALWFAELTLYAGRLFLLPQ
jgi:hypothetical protein